MPYRKTVKTEAKKAEMRARLIQAGRDAFATQGYEAATLQQIVRQAGTSIGNCYFYFPDKEALLEAVAQEIREEIAHAVDVALASVTDTNLRLALGIAVALRSILQNPDVARITLAVPSARAATVAYFTERSERRFGELAVPEPAGAPLLVAHAWQGAIFFIAEAALAGRFVEDAATVTRFLVGWNLQALGLPKTEIRRLLEQVEAWESTEE